MEFLAWEQFSSGVPCLATQPLSYGVPCHATTFLWGALPGNHFLMGCLGCEQLS
jgi:hypothetical protein